MYKKITLTFLVTDTEAENLFNEIQGLLDNAEIAILDTTTETATDEDVEFAKEQGII